MKRIVGILDLLVASACVVASAPRAVLALPQGAWTGEGNQQQAKYGTSLATAGDVNGDGFSDFIVGAPLLNDGIEDQGKVFAYYGSPDGLGALDWSDVGLSFEADYGRSVACAGDVNGDGYDDVVVGAPRDEVGPVNEGRVFLYLGSAGGLMSFSWSDESGDAASGFGSSVAGAGDVNGDGYDDFLVGAPSWDSATQDVGAAFLYFGAADGAPVLGWSFEGAALFEAFGTDVSTAGDVNADGYDDVIIGAWGEDRCYVFHGGPSGPSGAPDKILASAVGSMFGWAVSTAGDTNGDGYADIMVGWPHWGVSEEGRALVYFGSASGVTVNNWNYENTVSGAQFGYDVACAGDVNGDGFSDILIGAQKSTSGQSEEGRAYLFYGSENGPLAQAFWIADAEQVGAHLGYAVAGAGDVNGDGYSDIGAGARDFDNPETDEGRVAVWHGAADAPGALIGWQGEENQELAEYGHAVALGDFNGDGYADIVVGTGKWDVTVADEGRVWVYSGRDTPPSTAADWSADGSEAGGRFGDDVASALDVNNDGYDDLLVGEPGHDNDRGAAHLFLGAAGGLSASPDWSVSGERVGDQYGYAVAAAGDVNGDGFGDVIIGAPTHTGSLLREGKAYVYLGSETGLDASPVWTGLGGQQDASFGFSVSSAGDVNADGRTDVIVGAPLYDRAGVDEGMAAVYLGSLSGVDAAPVWTAISDQSGGQFGFAVAAAGDADGDNHSDVAVGAPYYDSPNIDAGRVLVYRGDSHGVQGAPFAQISLGQAGGAFGWSLASADLNIDGLSDLIAGAPFVDNGQLDEGQVYAYPGPLDDLSLWFGVDGNAPLAWHGTSVASGGDVTGDGYPDIVTGLPGLENPHVHEGVAHLWFGNAFWGPGLASQLRDGLDRRPRIRRDDDSAPIALLGQGDAAAALFRAHGRTPMGRDQVRMEIEVKRFGIPFDGAGTTITDFHDTGVPASGVGSRVEISQLVSGLLDDTMYRWRLRLVSDHPFWKRSPWFTHPGNNATELDFRSGSETTDVAATSPRPASLEVAGRPTPFARATTLFFRLDAAGSVRVAIHDAQGRLIRILADGVRQPGAHQVEWAGDDRLGRLLPSGVYFAVVETEREMRSARIVIAR
jgi:hypothetical protein